MTAPFRAIIIACCFLLVVCWSASPGLCEKSELDKFEKDATKQTDHHDKDKKDDNRTVQPNDDSDHSLSSVFGQLIWIAGKLSYERVADPAACRAHGLVPRRPGDPLLPFARVDISLRSIDMNVRDDLSIDMSLHSIDLLTEFGYGPFAIQYNESHYREHEPTDRMMISEFFGLYRMALGSSAELDLGGGTLTLHGNASTNRGAITFPLLIHPQGSHLGVEFRPAWAERIGDYDLALMYSFTYSSLKAGYRWVESPNASLSGPYVGLSFRL